MAYGYTEDQVLDMPLDKYQLLVRAAVDLDIARRRNTVMDLSAAVGGLFEKNGVTEYINDTLSGDLGDD